jgi:hypothetical protein
MLFAVQNDLFFFGFDGLYDYIKGAKKENI